MENKLPHLKMALFLHSQINPISSLLSHEVKALPSVIPDKWFVLMSPTKGRLTYYLS